MLFRLAKCVHGWGRIFAVAFLKPETQEIRDWFLYEGADNTIIPQYSADDCLQKSGAAQRLAMIVSEQEYEAIGKLIKEALSDGPCPGLTDAKPVLMGYLLQSAYHRSDKQLAQMIIDSSKRFGFDQDVINAARNVVWS
jgi:hypothetical protein